MNIDIVKYQQRKKIFYFCFIWSGLVVVSPLQQRKIYCNQAQEFLRRFGLNCFGNFQDLSIFLLPRDHFHHQLEQLTDSDYLDSTFTLCHYTYFSYYLYLCCVYLVIYFYFCIILVGSHNGARCSQMYHDLLVYKRMNM